MLFAKADRLESQSSSFPETGFEPLRLSGTLARIFTLTNGSLRNLALKLKMYASLKPGVYTFQVMPSIEVSERALIKLAAWMEKKGLDDFSDAILILLGEKPENRIEIIPAPRILEVDYDQARKELVKLEEVEEHGGDD